MSTHFSRTESKNLTKGKQCFQKARQDAIEIQTLKRKNKEADHRIINHTYLASHQHESKCIFADDTEVLILLLYIFQICRCEIYFGKATYLSKKAIPYHSISLLSQYLGASACDVLPAFHELTFCNYTYQFYGCCKYRRSKIM